MSRVAIIGSGAAGLMAGKILANEAFIFDQRPHSGSKVLISGGGRCNFTTTESAKDTVEHYYGKKNFVSPSIYSFPPEKITSFFNSLGIRTKSEGKKIFPSSNSAKDIVEALGGDARLYLNEKVLDIKKEEGLFKIKTDRWLYDAEFLIISSGGITYPQTGSDGSLFPIIKTLGHTIVPPRGVLSEIILENNPLRNAEGVSLNLTLKKGKTQLRGDAVITENGISGPVAENFSHYIQNGDVIELSFLEFTQDDLNRLSGKAMLKNALPLAERLTASIFPSLKDKKIGSLRKEERAEIIEKLRCFKIKATINFKKAMCTSGGVSTDEINRKSMESKIVENLYFAGEVIDVDGECGGYNITWAFSSAYTAAHDILSKMQRKLNITR